MRGVVMRLILALVSGFIFFGRVAAQPKPEAIEFVPVPADESLLNKLCNGYQLDYKEELTHLPFVNKKDYQDIYNERWKSIKERFDKQEIYTDPAAQAYLDAVVMEIVNHNPILKATPFHCYFSRSRVPNAEYIGEGIILINM